jgi:hypothetical protein
MRLKIIPGKEALSAINAELQARFQVSLTSTSIVEAMSIAEVPGEMKLLLSDLAEFSTRTP